MSKPYQLRLPKSRKAQSAAHDRAPKQEREASRRLGGRLTPGSGNKDIKGDVKVDRIIRLELKVTSKRSFSITQDMIRKIEMAGLGSGEIPCIEVEFLDKNKRPVHKVAVLPSYVLDFIVQERTA